MTRRTRAAGLVVGAALLASACAGAPAEVAGGASPAPDDGTTGRRDGPATPAGGPTRPADDRSAAAGDPAAQASPPVTSGAPGAVSCAGVERPPLQTGSHLLGGREPPVPFSSQPPTSGWHASGHVDVDVRSRARPLTEPEQVSVLEAGGVVVTHRGLAADDVARLRDRVRSRYAARVAVTPYDGVPSGAVAFAAWGRLQRCEGLDLTALDRFVERFGPSGPITAGH
ncbi:MAG TPA: DUF3105 domain-containing protein [Euzebyales bacterium]